MKTPRSRPGRFLFQEKKILFALFLPAQEICLDAFQHIARRTGGIAVQTPHDLDCLAISKQAFPLAAALAFNGLAGKVQLRLALGCIAAATAGGEGGGNQDNPRDMRAESFSDEGHFLFLGRNRRFV